MAFMDKTEREKSERRKSFSSIPRNWSVSRGDREGAVDLVRPLGSVITN
jgi:hypothetical protein